VTSQAQEMVAETVPASVARIRQFAVDACRSTAAEVDVDTVALLVSEVATNALVHGTGQVLVRVLPAASAGVRVEVRDGSSRLPARRRATSLDEGGRGIALVEELAHAWGSELTADGKTVWFELSADVLPPPPVDGRWPS
jgi:anti-sigma regulatory factor (Ser/Thr protein kinase)